MKNHITIVRSESFTKSKANLSQQGEILNQAIKDFVHDSERVINIQLVENSGLERFWIYTEEK